MGREAPPSPVAPDLPPIILTCRPGWRLLYSAAAAALLALGTDSLVALLDHPVPGWLDILTPVVLLIAGAGAASFVARFGLAVVTIDDRGFRVAGPFIRERVDWGGVERFARLPPRGGPALLRIVHGDHGRRLTLPLIYRDSHLIELGLLQRGFPRD
jgi:hypothetical protein